ncbi:MAG: hypothetical protein E7623_05260 [Ruminococcaceae bacterium]|nr:hypothetical protein [Oscillospiraceae bacterium]
MVKRICLLILTLAIVLVSFCYCVGGDYETETNEQNTEAETEPQEYSVDIKPAEGIFLNTYADYERAIAWLEQNIVNTDTPPVTFSVGERSSDDLVWEKTFLQTELITDYEDSGTPVVRSCSQFKYDCKEENLQILLTLTTYPGYPVVEYDTRLINTANGNSNKLANVLPLDSAIIDNSKNVVVHYNEGGENMDEEGNSKSTAFAARSKKIKVEEGFELGSLHGVPTHGYIPYLNFENKADNNGTIAVVNWQGGWKVTADVSDGAVQVTGGVAETNFVMLEGENFKLPGIVLLFYKNGDWQFGQNVWRRWYIEHNMFRYQGTRDFTENVYMCSSLGGTEKDLAAIEKMAKSVIGENYNIVFEMDAGWYNYHGVDWGYTGDWSPSELYGTEGLVKIREKLTEVGAKMCLWLEPERVWFALPQGQDLKDNMIYLRSRKYFSYSTATKNGQNPRMGLVNYSKQEAVDYVIELLDKTVKQYGLDVYRQDFNFNNLEYWQAYDKYEQELLSVPRDGVTELKACEGYINVWTEVENRNPGLIFDSCASGGRRLDLETLRFAFAHTKCDYWMDTLSAQGQNFGSLSWFPFTGTGFANDTNLYDIRSRLTLSIGVNCTIDSNFERTNAALTEWQSLHKYMLKDYYQLTEYSLNEKNDMAMQFNYPENGEGMMIAYMRRQGKKTFNFLPKGLDPDKNYKVWNKDDESNVCVMSGEKFMTEGFSLSKDERLDVLVVMYEMTNEA